ncbi:hypothetical protein P3W45_000250 [Vairimorpha bombi]
MKQIFQNDTPKLETNHSQENTVSSSVRKRINSINNVVSNYNFNSERISSVHNLDVSRIPRCSTAFDNLIPGYFETNFGRMIYDVDKLYRYYGLVVYEYFDGNALDIQSIKKSENRIYLNKMRKSRKNVYPKK